MAFRHLASDRQKGVGILLIPGIGITLLLSYHWIFYDYFPAGNGNIGHDYSYFLPMLLDGYYWQLSNGLLTPQWFTASFCGGLPAFANPQNLYYSLPQWLVFLTDPLSAVYITNLVFAAFGLIGFYLLLHLGFRTSKTTAIFGAALFLFNGFYASRMMIGHLSYHPFMLIPLIAFLSVCKPGGKGFLSTALFTSFSAVLFSYWIYAGMVNLILPAIISLIFIGLLHGFIFGLNKTYWLKLAVAGLLGIVLSLPKLSSALAFLGNFERASYSLPGADSIWDLLVLSFNSVFLQPPVDMFHKVMVNLEWTLGRHELEYGISVIPLIAVLIGLAYFIKFKLLANKLGTQQWLCIAGLGLVLVIPLAFNYYSPVWNALLKETPVIRNSSTLIRWFCVYIIAFILLAAIAIEKTAWLAKFRLYFVTVGIVSVIILSAATNREYYANQRYSPKKITAAYQQTKQIKKPPTISMIIVSRNKNGKIYRPINRNDTLVIGASQMYCYEPIFGYGLESLPIRPLRAGRVNSQLNGNLNLKNPACYVFPEANDCRPGDHFKGAQYKEAEAFASHKPFAFEAPDWLKPFNMASISLLVVIIGFWILSPFIAYFRKNYIADKL